MANVEDVQFGPFQLHRRDERLWREGGALVLTLLAEVYGWFTKGFDTAELCEARALLEALADRH